ncbi:hypothetical protein [Microvirga alba]|uniref:Uncharacterized protein n=1 Tax=Microvirga alba TaxID=2791025 RepID=A0A931BNP8_9HYPH|nr:hypothetical protein [Microvirga alba]MBF9234616.1 hypothetical protein [Microvirga alba]
MSLRDAFLRDFKVDLPVGDGAGTRTDPISILTGDPHGVSRAAEITLSLLQKGGGYAQGSEIFWRILARELHEEAGKVLFRLGLQRVALTPTEVVGEKVSYFFSTPQHLLDAVPTPYVIHIDPSLALAFPFKIAGLDYSAFRDFEREQSGLGYCVGYSGPRVEATLYVYKADIAAPPEMVARRELDSTLRQLHGSHQGVRPYSDTSFGAHALGVELNLGDHRRGLVMIDSVGPKLFKWRVTWLNDERRTIVEEFVRQSRQLLPRDQGEPQMH